MTESKLDPGTHLQLDPGTRPTAHLGRVRRFFGEHAQELAGAAAFTTIVHGVVAITIIWFPLMYR